jgi:hypothetical protein
MKKLTKEDIIKGKDKRETLHIDSYDADVIIRPLTDGELGDVFAIIGNTPIKDDGKPDTGKIDVTKNFKALRLATSIGLIEPKLTIEDVADMRFGVPEFIGTKILKISGITSAGAAKKKEES